MVFTYTEIFKSASPIRGGTPVGAMAGGNFGETVGAMATGSGLISTTLATVKIVQLETYGNAGSASMRLLSISSNGMVDIGGGIGLACSGNWIAYGI